MQSVIPSKRTPWLACMAACALLAGCASRTLPEQYTLNPKGDKGLVVVSLSYAGTMGLYNLYVRSVDGSVRERFVVGQPSYVPIPQKFDINEGAFRGDVYSTELPVGAYTVERWNVDTYSSHVSANTPIPFTVEPGKVTYLGRFEFVPTDTNGVVIYGAKASVKDRSEQDMAIVASRTPSLKNEPIALNVSTSEASRSLSAKQPKSEYVAPFIFIPPAR